MRDETRSDRLARGVKARLRACPDRSSPRCRRESSRDRCCRGSAGERSRKGTEGAWGLRTRASTRCAGKGVCAPSSRVPSLGTRTRRREDSRPPSWAIHICRYRNASAREASGNCRAVRIPRSGPIRRCRDRSGSRSDRPDSTLRPRAPCRADTVPGAVRRARAPRAARGRRRATPARAR